MNSLLLLGVVGLVVLFAAVVCCVVVFCVRFFYHRRTLIWMERDLSDFSAELIAQLGKVPRLMTPAEREKVNAYRELREQLKGPVSRDDVSEAMRLLNKYYSKSNSRVQDRPEPPRVLELLLELATKREHRESIVGCLEEEFHRNARRRGARRARFIYASDVCRSLTPLI